MLRASGGRRDFSWVGVLVLVCLALTALFMVGGRVPSRRRLAGKGASQAWYHSSPSQRLETLGSQFHKR